MTDYKDLLKKIPPQHYLHVLNNNSNVVRVEVGPKTLLLLDEEVAVHGPAPMIVVPPRHYVIIENPVCAHEDEFGRRVIEYDNHKQSKLKHGATEIRLEQDPFPLYPGEVLKGKVEPLEVVPPNEALKLEATHDFFDRYANDRENNRIFRKAGDKWLFYGPQTYIPQPEVRIVHSIKAEVIKPNQAIKLEAINNFLDRNEVERRSGEQWIYFEEGSFIPDLNEKVVERIQGIILTDKRSIHVEAIANFTDQFGQRRRAGEVWLVTKDDTEVYIPPVQVRVINNDVQMTTLNRRQYCTLVNPHDDNGKPQYGLRLRVIGETCFFLNPFEQVEETMSINVLTAEESIIVQATESFDEIQYNEEIEKGPQKKKGRSIIKRKAGEKWFIYGPKEYCPPCEVNMIQRKRAIFRIEALNFYVFREDKILLGVFGVIIFLFFFMRLIRAIF